MAKLNYNGNPFTSAVSYADLSDAPLINGNKISSDSTSRSLQIVWKGTIEQYKALPEKIMNVFISFLNQDRKI